MKLLRLMWGELFIVLVIVLGLYANAYAEPGISTKRPAANSVGFEAYVDNPNAYIMGSLVCRDTNDCQIAKRGATGRVVTEMSINPFGTFALYSEHLSLCGNHADDFNGKTGAVVITYRRVAHEMPGGVACHDLVGVFKVIGDDAP